MSVINFVNYQFCQLNMSVIRIIINALKRPPKERGPTFKKITISANPMTTTLSDPDPSAILGLSMPSFQHSAVFVEPEVV